jgi:hypothetical protein
MGALLSALVMLGMAIAPGPDVPNIVANPSSGPATSTIAVTAHFPYVDCPIKDDPSVRFMWDGAVVASTPMNGRCDVATTISPPPGSRTGVHALDAIVVDSHGETLTARGLFTVEAAPAPTAASSVHSTAPPAGAPGKSGRYALFTLLVAALVLVAAVRWRRASRRR